MNVHVSDDGKVFMNALLPSPNNLKVLRDGLGNPIGLIISPDLNAGDVEIFLGLEVETVFIDHEHPINDVAGRIAGL